jgi:hypothetical protein
MPTNPALVSNIVNGTRSASAGAGDQTLTGFGFDPTTVHMMAQTNPRTKNGSYGWGDDDADQEVWANIEGTPAWNMSADIVYIDVGSSDWMSATVDSYIDDGVIITWVKGGSGQDIIFSIIGFR